MQMKAQITIILSVGTKLNNIIRIVLSVKSRSVTAFNISCQILEYSNHIIWAQEFFLVFTLDMASIMEIKLSIKRDR